MEFDHNSCLINRFGLSRSSVVSYRNAALYNLLLNFLFSGLACVLFLAFHMTAMAEASAGILKVVVVQGKRLAVRDFKSSDPYVIIKLGNQAAKTKVINSCLNPVWNEELTLTLTEPVGVLNLEVFDRDRFKADDKMGHAHLNLQPLASAARLKQVLQVPATGETTLRKVIPASDNCLVRDSSINCVNGEVIQGAWLRLCDVESGEIELMLKLINYPPISPSF